jgi:hypothetical protein
MQPGDPTAASDNARRADRKVALHSKVAIVDYLAHPNHNQEATPCRRRKW